MLANLHPRSSPRPPDWAQPPERSRLMSEEVHVWLADIRQPAARVESLSRLLSPDESRRAKSFHFTRHREAFAVARGMLRTILASYTGAHPRDLEFAYSPYGKPSLSGTHDGCDLRFNLSHSHGLALYAVAHSREVGVDIEYCRPRVAFAEIAERFFSPLEVENFRRLPEQLRREAFFNCWTRKEAFIKAVGEGLSFPLDAFDVSLTPGEPATLLGVRVNGREASRWRLRELQPGPGYVGAVTAEGQDWRLKCWLAYP
ncbi:MAG: 4'-phosphopantetheinyl transferase family protein [Pyrinomonadaceae bacterium]